MSNNGYYPIVTISGSMRFFSIMLEKAKELTSKDCVVLMPFVTIESKKSKSKLDRLHLHKISLSDYVYIINLNGYIGDSTREEILYARKKGIPVKYLEPLTELDVRYFEQREME